MSVKSTGIAALTAPSSRKRNGKNTRNRIYARALSALMVIGICAGSTTSRARVMPATEGEEVTVKGVLKFGSPLYSLEVEGGRCISVLAPAQSLPVLKANEDLKVTLSGQILPYEDFFTPKYNHLIYWHDWDVIDNINIASCAQIIFNYTIKNENN